MIPIRGAAAKIAALSPATRRVPYAEYGCVLHRKHRPVPSRVELHHRFPMYLQAKVWLDVDPTKPATAHDKERIPVCEGGHSDVHVAINALILGGPLPKGIGTAERKEARDASARYFTARDLAGMPK